MQDALTVYGYVQFIDESTPGALWTLTDAGDWWEVDVPYPPNEIQPVNVPLRLALARCVFGVLNDDISPNIWYDLTSVVRRDQLADAFPIDSAALTALTPRRLATLVSPHPDDDPLPHERPWRLAGAVARRSARRLVCADGATTRGAIGAGVVLEKGVSRENPQIVLAWSKPFRQTFVKVSVSDQLARGCRRCYDRPQTCNHLSYCLKALNRVL